MNSQRKQAIKSNEISEVTALTLGGFPQKILIDGRRKENPLLLVLHGGPGSPIPFSVGCRGLFPEITERFTLVCWDQLGCGINNRRIGDEFHISDFVKMTRDLILALRGRFPENKLYLLGMSWGSILALGAAELTDGVVTYGQVLRDLPYNETVFRALETSKMPQREKAWLSGAKNSTTVENAKRIMRDLQKYTEGYMVKGGEKSPIGAMILGLWQSPDYRFRDFKAIVVNGYLKNRSLLKELLTVDLRKELAAATVPYTIVQGENDLVTPTDLIAEFMKTQANEWLRLTVVPRNGHIPAKSGLDAVMKEITRLAEL